MPGRYEAKGLEAACEPGSRGRVLRNKLGITSVREMQRVESEALLEAQDWTADELLRCGYSQDPEVLGRSAGMNASGFSAGRWKGRRMPSTAEEVAADRLRAALRTCGSRRYGLVSAKDFGIGRTSQSGNFGSADYRMVRAA